jgi:CarD family transcriptional regulator
MHKIGENVVYGASGVMTVVDIREETVGDNNRSYYVLAPYGSHAPSYTFVPLDNEALVAQMLPLLTKDEIYEILHSYGGCESIEWINENRARSEYFKTIVESGDRARIMAMIDAIMRSGKRRNDEGKKNYLSDENIMRKAEKIVHLEFSLVLGIPEEEIGAFIEREIAKKPRLI